MTKLLPLVVGFSLATLGCQSGTMPSPEEPADLARVPLQTVRDNLQADYEQLRERVDKQEITEAKLHEVLRERASKFAAKVDATTLTNDNAWIIADILRCAEQWHKARAALQIAVRTAKTEDRRVNDTLHLAQVEAKLGNVDKVIPLARSVFSAGPRDKGPILPAILFEIVPAAEGKGIDKELADLLLDAAEQHKQVEIDRDSDAGKLFLAARPFHINRAFRRAMELYKSSGNMGAAKAMLRR